MSVVAATHSLTAIAAVPERRGPDAVPPWEGARPRTGPPPLVVSALFRRLGFPKGSRTTKLPVKILCTADVHIGRRPSRLPPRIDSGPLSCARAWTSVVETAIAERVDLVAIAGDLVDQANRFYEAAGPVEAGVRALVSHGIRTVAVAGNHDYDTLPWIADRFDRKHFTLLGRGGSWERLTIETEGTPRLHLEGWSFPAARYAEDPVRAHPGVSRDGVPVLGLLHADLDQPASRHAPVALASLRSLPVDFWLLGHVHRHSIHEQPGGATVLYPGSPQPMDPGEPGAHGAWLLEIDSGGRFSTRHLPLATVRYDTLEVDVGGVEAEGELDRRVTDAVAAELRRVEEDAGPLRHLSLRLRLTGRTPLHRTLRARRSDFAAELEVSHGGVTAVVERVDIVTRPPRDLRQLSLGQDAVGILAKLLLGLEEQSLDAEHARLVQSVALRASQVRSARPYLPLGDSGDSLATTEVQAILGEQAMHLLDELLAQKEAP
jgi:DNA repair protein SbcD/Mre11